MSDTDRVDAPQVSEPPHEVIVFEELAQYAADQAAVLNRYADAAIGDRKRELARKADRWTDAAARVAALAAPSVAGCTDSWHQRGPRSEADADHGCPACGEWWADTKRAAPSVAPPQPVAVDPVRVLNALKREYGDDFTCSGYDPLDLIDAICGIVLACANTAAPLQELPKHTDICVMRATTGEWRCAKGCPVAAAAPGLTDRERYINGRPDAAPPAQSTEPCRDAVREFYGHRAFPTV